ncbi:MAG: hypothetical protein WBA02_01685 [Jannaschia helgolandensis]|nr:hypothetical protein [Jannaschia helgolandensis]
MMVEHAYKLPMLKDMVGSGKIGAWPLHFGVTDINGAIPLVTGTMDVAASTDCCTCNDANPPEQACAPC